MLAPPTGSGEARPLNDFFGISSQNCVDYFLSIAFTFKMCMKMVI